MTNNQLKPQFDKTHMVKNDFSNHLKTGQQITNQGINPGAEST